MSLLMGVASQTAVSITNARSFQKLQESEKKYRDLVENANSIILRRDIERKITFFNEYAQKLFGYSEDEILGKNIVGTIFQDSDRSKKNLENLTTSLEKNPEHL
ncbi:MAG: PAS domain S-box protein, partial [Deltaproteobacteria bacterium]|nr:PAS domain S-box protein [Deltaproteobacteria bacterium]